MEGSAYAEDLCQRGKDLSAKDGDSMSDTIAIDDLRKQINKLMRYHASEMRRWKDALRMHADENDYALNAKLSIEAAMHQGAWCTLLCLAGDLKIGTGDDAEGDEATIRFGIESSVVHNGVKYTGKLYPAEVVDTMKQHEKT